jgi:hypothetical protein
MIRSSRILFSVILTMTFLTAQSQVDGMKNPNVHKVEMGFPTGMECLVQPYYRYRADGKPGREIILKLSGPKLLGKAKVEVAVKGKKETTEIAASTFAFPRSFGPLSLSMISRPGLPSAR